MLLHARLERERIEEPVRAVRLRVADAAVLTDYQPEFFGQGESHGLEGASALVDCLSGRLGARAVTRVRLVEDFQPEYACRFEPLIQPEMPKQGTPQRRPGKAQRRQQKDRWSGSQPLRPLRLWPRPVRIDRHSGCAGPGKSSALYAPGDPSALRPDGGEART